MVRAFEAYLDFCYLVRRNVITEDTLNEITAALDRFHQYREIFLDTGVCKDFALPRQHAMKHYRQHIENFGAPNGLCSSITESKHIVTVKRPWRRSSKFRALKQMLRTNQRLDKMAAARVHFETLKMLDGSLLNDIDILQVAAGDTSVPDDRDCGADDGPWLPSNQTRLAATRGALY